MRQFFFTSQGSNNSKTKLLFSIKNCTFDKKHSVHKIAFPQSWLKVALSSNFYKTLLQWNWTLHHLEVLLICFSTGLCCVLRKRIQSRKFLPIKESEARFLLEKWQLQRNRVIPLSTHDKNSKCVQHALRVALHLLFLWHLHAAVP